MGFKRICQAVDRALAHGRIVKRLRIVQTHPTQQRAAGLSVFKDPVKIRAKDLAIAAQRAIRSAVIQSHGGVSQRGSFAAARMDLIAADAGRVESQLSADVVQLLMRLKHSVEVQMS